MMTAQKTPTLSEIKAANREFFSRKNNAFFGTYRWTKSGHIVSADGKHGLTFRRWVNYDTLDLSIIREIMEKIYTDDGYRVHKSRWFVSLRGPEFRYQEIDQMGEFVGEPITNDEYHSIPRA